MSKIRHFILPDCQCKDGVPTEHLTWAGKYAAEKKPSTIVCLGDFADMPSLSTYDVGKKSFEGRRYTIDIECAKDCMSQFMAPIREEQLRLKRNKEKQWNPELIFTLGNHCLSEDTQVYVEDKGWCNYQEIAIGDKVYTIDDQGNYETNTIKDTVCWDADEELYTSDTCASSLLITSGHRVYYKTSAGHTRVKLASEFNCEFDLLTSANSNVELVHLDDLELQLAGWLCTDSHFSKDGSISFYQRASNAHKIEELLQELSIQYTKTVRLRNTTEICGKVLLKPAEPEVTFRLNKSVAELLRGRLLVFNNRQLPVWTCKLTNRQWDIFLNVLIDADGSIPKRGKTSRVFYGKRPICEDVQVQAHLHGWRASITEYRKGQFRVNLTKTDTARTRLTKVPYKGRVWCISVKNKNFMVRRNNKVCFTGNCERINRAVNSDPKLEGLISIDDLKYQDFGWKVFPYLSVVVEDGIAYCLEENHRVLKADLTYCPLKDLKIGDELVGFEEKSDSIKGRKYKTAIVTKLTPVLAPVFRVTLTNGKSFVATGDHKWLVKPYGSTSVWKHTLELLNTDVFPKYFDEWEEDASKSSGWLSGFFDGEGWLSKPNSSQGGIQIGGSQNEGSVLSKLKSLLTSKGIKFFMREYRDCKQINIGGSSSEKIKFLGTIRPIRLLEKFKVEMLGRMQKIESPKVASVVPLEEERVVMQIETTTSTLIVEGYAHHNCHYFTSGILGRPVTSARMLLTKHHMSCVAGHQQGRDIAYGKRADGTSMTGLISGSFYQHSEDYLTPQTNEHWRGVWLLNDIKDGSFDELPISLNYLKERYGSK